MSVVGGPFVEIVKIANDLDGDLVVIGLHGDDTGIEHLLFGGGSGREVRPTICASI